MVRVNKRVCLIISMVVLVFSSQSLFASAEVDKIIRDGCEASVDYANVAVWISDGLNIAIKNTMPDTDERRQGLNYVHNEWQEFIKKDDKRLEIELDKINRTKDALTAESLSLMYSSMKSGRDSIFLIVSDNLGKDISEYKKLIVNECLKSNYSFMNNRSQSSPRAQTYAPRNDTHQNNGTTCYYSRGWFSGMYLNCVYNCMGSEVTRTIPAAQQCASTVTQ